MIIESCGLSYVQILCSSSFWHSDLTFVISVHMDLFWIEDIFIWVAAQRVLMLGLSDVHSAIVRVCRSV